MRTVIQVLRDNALHADRAVTFVRTASAAGGGGERVVPYPELWQIAQDRARALRSLGLEKGDRVALVLPETDEFVLTFLGALVGGIVPVPMYPPQTLAKLETYGDTVKHVLAASGARVLVTNDALAPMLAEHVTEGEHLTAIGGSLRVVRESQLPHSAAGGIVPVPDLPIPDVGLDDLAFLQFTSGSTSRPKGVMVTFRNLAVNSHSIMFDGLRATPADKGLSWLPLFHDMGLIGFVIAPLYALVQVMFLPTMAFIRRPSLWLDAVHRFRATITFAPNFAFALATRAVTDAQAAGWDLSSLRALGCGAEPIQPDVLRAFLDRFEKIGLRPESILPSYGMAEATLAISFAGVNDRLTTDRVDPEGMRRGEARRTDVGGMELVGCGRAFPGHEVSVVDPTGEALGERQVGEIWLRGPCVTRGYFGDPEATEETFGGGWLRTGDLGYQADGHLYICGRAKDLIILNGRNYYPQDLEQAVSRVEGVRDGQCVAFSRLDATGGEVGVVVAEARRHSQELVDAISSAVRSEVGVTLGEVVLIKRGTLPKTSSGKVKRRETKRRYEDADLAVLGPGLVAEGDSVAPPEAVAST